MNWKLRKSHSESYIILMQVQQKTIIRKSLQMGNKIAFVECILIKNLKSFPFSVNFVF